MHGFTEYAAPLQDIISNQVKSMACKLSIPVEFESKLRNREQIKSMDALALLKQVRSNLQRDLGSSVGESEWLLFMINIVLKRVFLAVTPN